MLNFGDFPIKEKLLAMPAIDVTVLFRFLAAMVTTRNIQPRNSCEMQRFFR